MGRLVKIDGAPEWDAADVTTVQDATPLDPSDTFGGTGTVSFTIPSGVGSKSIMGEPVELTDSRRGTVHGVVAAISGDRANVRVQAHSRMVALVATRTASPHVGTLESCLLYYFGLCGVTTGIVVDPAVADIPVIAPGWFGNVWEMVAKNFCPAYQVEVSLVGDEIVVRPPRTVTVSRVRESQFDWSIDESQLAQTVEAWYYPCAQITNALVIGNDLSPVSNIDAGEVHEFDIDIPASLSSVVQPVAVDAVSYDAADASEYSVLDQFDQPVDADYWRRNGGYVTVEISDDTRSLHVTVVGCQERSRAPYRLTAVAADGSEFSTLRIIGTGVSMSRAKYTMPAAIDAAPMVGAEVDNDFLGSWGHAHLALLHTAGRHGSPVQRLTGAADFDGEFGNIAGARVFEDLNVYRIRPATITPAEVGYAAETDLTFADTTEVNAGHVISDWNDLWAGRPISEYNLRPLTPLPGEVAELIYPSATTFPSSSTFPEA